MPLTIKDIEKKKDILTKVVELGKKHRLSILADQSENENGDISKALQRLLEEDKDEIALENYMMSLDFDDIKMIQTLMFLGRDQEYNLNDSYSKRFKNVYASLEHQTKDDKLSKIRYMIGKVRFDEFVKDGLNAVGISL